MEKINLEAAKNEDAMKVALGIVNSLKFTKEAAENAWKKNMRRVK
jgi:hypothetical protein